MRRYFHHILAFALAFTLAVPLLSGKTLAATGDTFSAVNQGKTIYYQVTGDNPATVKVIAPPTDKYTGDIVIPATVTNGAATYQVTAIGKNAFDGCKNLTSVVIPEGVTTIEYNAFFSCSNPFTVVIPSSVTHIEESAFQGCINLTHSGALLPTGLRTLGPNAFTGNNLLTSITIPGGVQVVSHHAFYASHGLKSVTLEHGVETIDVFAFANCYALTDVKIPNSVTSIGDGAFANCYALTSITLPYGLETLGKQAFAMLNLTSKLSDVTLPDTLTSIGENAFEGCDLLSGVTLQVGDNTTITDTGFTPEGGTLVTIPNGKPITKVELLPGGQVTNNTGKDLQVETNGNTITLPSGITYPPANPMDPADNQVTGLTSGASITKGTQVTFTAAGAGMTNPTPLAGNTRYLPVSWEVNTLEPFPADGSYTGSFDTSELSPGSHTLAITYQLQWYDGTSWQDMAQGQYTQSIPFTVTSPPADPIDPPKADPATPTSATPTAIEDPGSGNPSTGDSSMIAWLSLSALAAVCAATLLIRHRQTH